VGEVGGVARAENVTVGATVPARCGGDGYGEGVRVATSKEGGEDEIGLVVKSVVGGVREAGDG
jgi:hypothetical protein